MTKVSSCKGSKQKISLFVAELVFSCVSKWLAVSIFCVCVETIMEQVKNIRNNAAIYKSDRLNILCVVYSFGFFGLACTRKPFCMRRSSTFCHSAGGLGLVDGRLKWKNSYNRKSDCHLFYLFWFKSWHELLFHAMYFEDLSKEWPVNNEAVETISQHLLDTLKERHGVCLQVNTCTFKCWIMLLLQEPTLSDWRGVSQYTDLRPRSLCKINVWFSWAAAPEQYIRHAGCQHSKFDSCTSFLAKVVNHHDGDILGGWRLFPAMPDPHLWVSGVSRCHTILHHTYSIWHLTSVCLQYPFDLLAMVWAPELMTCSKCEAVKAVQMHVKWIYFEKHQGSRLRSTV